MDHMIDELTKNFRATLIAYHKAKAAEAPDTTALFQELIKAQNMLNSEVEYAVSRNLV